MLVFLCLALIVLIGSRLGRAMANKKDTFSGTAVNWHLAQLNDGGAVAAGLKLNSSYVAAKDISHETENQLSKISQPIVKNSNHVKSAEKYAYDTKYVQEVITGKKVHEGDKVVFLTFDDGPNNTISPKVLDILKNEGVHGTFFLVGKGIGEKYRTTLTRELIEGHGIATHSMTHEYTLLYPGRTGNPDRILYEVDKMNEVLKGFYGPDFQSNVFRYPGGHMSWKGLDKADAVLSSHGIQWIDWNVMTGDAQPKKERPVDTAGILAFLDKSVTRANVKSMVVVLMHDGENKDLTVESLPSVIKYFKDAGYSFG
ncbi:MAG: polysaccharide deacetylase family protein, partial [Gallicola sp.]|nr:polysaccharide deacetylase family protein [Gallicola sp.]